MTRWRLGQPAKRMLLAASSLSVSLLLLLVGLELVLRLSYARRLSQERAEQGVARGKERFWATYDPDLGYRLTPGLGDVNEDGYLGRAVGPKGDRFRILLLGDSVGFYGDGPADTYVAHLERRLRSHPALTPIEIINGSVIGYTNYQEVGYLEKYGLAHEPDLVGVGFVLNDLHRFLHAFEIADGKIIGQGYGFAQEAEAGIEHPLFRLARKSRAVLWLKNRFSIVGRLAEVAAPGAYTFEYRPDFASAWQPEAWVEIAAQLEQARDLGASHGFALFVHLFPYGQQLRPEYLERDPGYVLEPQRRLREICGRLAIPFLDLTPFLTRDHFEADDVHLTASGRREVAERISAFLISADLVPAADLP